MSIQLLCFPLMMIACYLLFMVSQKQLAGTLQSKWYLLATHRQLTRWIAWLILLISTGLLMSRYGRSIGLVSLFVFLTPFLLLLILSVNDLKQKIKPRR
ncbi:DUF1634 domain-containing protein [Acinetobacter sp. WZC-1]|uniref:DUF1634 domain-containing protein n=1 Tax=Acinetobacter sp. WZC-1 TaxID=3459034 RepID=UPI00403DDA5C